MFITVTLTLRPDSATLGLSADVGHVVAAGDGSFHFTSALPPALPPWHWRVTAMTGGRPIPIANPPLLYTPTVKVEQDFKPDRLTKGKPSMSIKASIRRHPVAAYFGMTFLVSWAGAFMVLSPSPLSPAQEVLWYAIYAAVLWGVVAIVVAAYGIHLESINKRVGEAR